MPADSLTDNTPYHLPHHRPPCNSPYHLPQRMPLSHCLTHSPTRVLVLALVPPAASPAVASDAMPVLLGAKQVSYSMRELREEVTGLSNTTPSAGAASSESDTTVSMPKVGPLPRISFLSSSSFHSLSFLSGSFSPFISIALVLPPLSLICARFPSLFRLSRFFVSLFLSLFLGPKSLRLRFRLASCTRPRAHTDVCLGIAVCLPLDNIAVGHWRRI